jgi:flagellar biosynthetic protein FliO
MEALRPLLGIAVVLGLLAGALWALRRRGGVTWARPHAGAGRLEVLERVALAPQNSLYLVRVDDRTLVIGVHAGGCTVLDKGPQ